MTTRSLRFRLIIAWAVFIILSLQVMGVGLRLMFERAITRRTMAELEADVRQLVKGTEIGPDGKLIVRREPTDPQFDIVKGGRYWQVQTSDGQIARSRSLQDFTLHVSAPPGSGEASQTWLIGPAHEALYAAMRRVTKQVTPSGAAAIDVVHLAAVDAAEIGEETNKFASDLFFSIAGLTLLFIAGAWAHVMVGLRPLERLRSSVAAVRTGEARHVDGEFPDEITPLVAETNALLDAQQTAVQKARTRASDLAHGLKTPLAVIGAKSRQLRREGQEGIAVELDRQVDSMRRHVERELARARARGASAASLARIDVTELLDAIVAAVRSLPRGERLDWQLDWPIPLDVRVDPDDFNNMIGNLVDNAHKWASDVVRISARQIGDRVSILVEDNGPGVAESDIQRVLRRGERADMSVQGSGLGLAIVSDLVELYGGELALSRSALGGLAADLRLPV